MTLWQEQVNFVRGTEVVIQKKNPVLAHEKLYPKKVEMSTLNEFAIFEHDPRPIGNETSAQDFINKCTATLPTTLNMIMWSTILQVTYDDYCLTDDELVLLKEKCAQFYANICDTVKFCTPPVQMLDTIAQADNNNWFRERWLRLTASGCKEAIGCKS